MQLWSLAINRRASRSCLLACVLGLWCMTFCTGSLGTSLAYVLVSKPHRVSSEICSTVCTLVKLKGLSLDKQTVPSPLGNFQICTNFTDFTDCIELESSCLESSSHLTDGKKPRVAPANLYSVSPGSIPGSLICLTHTASEWMLLMDV